MPRPWPRGGDSKSGSVARRGVSNDNNAAAHGHDDTPYCRPGGAASRGAKTSGWRHERPDMSALEAVDFDGLLVETQAVVLVREELLDLVALVALELDHVAHALGIGVVDDGAIAGWWRRMLAAESTQSKNARDAKGCGTHQSPS